MTEMPDQVEHDGGESVGHDDRSGMKAGGMTAEGR